MVKARAWAALGLALAACPTLDKKALENLPPLAQLSVTPEGVVSGGTRVTLDASASSDPEGRPLRFSWEQLAGDPLVFTGQGEPIATFEAPLRPQLVVFTVTVSDGKQEGAPAFARISIDFNTPPHAEVPDSREVKNGTQVLLSGRGTDADGDEITGYVWKVEAAPSAPGVPTPFVLSGETTAAAVFQPKLKGLYSLSLKVTDARGAVSLPGIVVVKALNVAPVALAGPPVTTPNLTAVTVTAAGTDADPDDALTFRWAWATIRPGTRTSSTWPSSSTTTAIAPAPRARTSPPTTTCRNSGGSSRGTRPRG